jgi:hypothetical protein
MKAEAAVTLAPAFGPAIVTFFGLDIPVLATGLSMLGLILARWIAPPPLRKLTGKQECALTALLLILLLLIVTGAIGSGEPLGPGVATIWGIGLVFGQRAIAMLKALVGHADK